MSKARPWQFDVIYADPPWPSEVPQKKVGTHTAAARDAMSLDQIRNVGVSMWAKPDSVLFIWATDLMLREALLVMRAWGFEYKAVGFYWVKGNAKKGGDFSNPGYYSATTPELCLLGTRGKGLKILRPGIGRLVTGPRRRGPQQAAAVMARIERLYGRVRRLQVLGGEKPDGWSAYRRAKPGDANSDRASMVLDTTLGDS